MVARELPQAVLIPARSNQGVAYPNNLAFTQARGPAILLLNPDAEASVGSLQGLLEALAAHAEAGVVGPKLLRADGSVQLACRGSLRSASVSLYRLPGLSRLFPRSPRFG